MKSSSQNTVALAMIFLSVVILGLALFMFYGIQETSDKTPTPTPSVGPLNLTPNQAAMPASPKGAIMWSVPSVPADNYVLPITATLKHEFTSPKLDDQGKVISQAKESAGEVKTQMYLLVNHFPLDPSAASVDLALSQYDGVNTNRDVYREETHGNYTKLENTASTKDPKTGKWSDPKKSENPMTDPNTKIFELRNSFLLSRLGVVSDHRRDMTSNMLFANKGVLFVADVLFNVNFPAEKTIQPGKEWIVNANYNLPEIVEPASFVTKWELKSLEKDIATLSFTSTGKMDYQMNRWVIQTKNAIKFEFEGDLVFDITKGIPTKARVNYIQKKREEYLNKELQGERVKNYNWQGVWTMVFGTPVSTPPADLPPRAAEPSAQPKSKQGPFGVNPQQQATPLKFPNPGASSGGNATPNPTPVGAKTAPAGANVTPTGNAASAGGNVTPAGKSAPVENKAEKE